MTEGCVFSPPTVQACEQRIAPQPHYCLYSCLPLSFRLGESERSSDLTSTIRRLQSIKLQSTPDAAPTVLLGRIPRVVKSNAATGIGEQPDLLLPAYAPVSITLGRYLGRLFHTDEPDFCR